MGTSPPPRCHLLRLANEILHSICNSLEEDNARTELSNLRLTCKALQFIPEEYLFRHVCLDSCFSSLESLQQLSQHHRISQYVFAVRVNIVFLTETLTHDEYNAKVASYGSLKPGQLRENVGNDSAVEETGAAATNIEVEDETESDEEAEEEWPPKTKYDKLLADERDSLTPGELAVCWDRCERTQLQQSKLKAMTMLELLDFLHPVFASLLNLTCFTCEGMGVGQYQWDSNGNSKLKLSQRRTLLPPVYGHEPDREEKDAVVKYSAACVAAILLAELPLYALRLSKIPWDTLLELSRFFISHIIMSALPELKRLEIAADAWGTFSDEDKAEGMAFVKGMLTLAPNLEKFNWRVGNHPHCGVTYFDLPDRTFLSRSPKLRKLTISGIHLAFSTAALQDFLTALPGHIRCLKLPHMSLPDGAWVDVFQLLHVRLRLQKFVFVELVEHDPVSRDVRRWLVLHQEEPAQASLLERLVDYVTRKTVTPPLTPSALGGSPELWESKCDGSLLYDTIAVGS